MSGTGPSARDGGWSAALMTKLRRPRRRLSSVKSAAEELLSVHVQVPFHVFRAMQRPHSCPRCGSSRVGEILWGFPILTRGLCEDIKRGA